MAVGFLWDNLDLISRRTHYNSTKAPLPGLVVPPLFLSPSRGPGWFPHHEMTTMIDITRTFLGWSERRHPFPVSKNSVSGFARTALFSRISGRPFSFQFNLFSLSTFCKTALNIETDNEGHNGVGYREITLPISIHWVIDTYTNRKSGKLKRWANDMHKMTLLIIENWWLEPSSAWQLKLPAAHVALWKSWTFRAFACRTFADQWGYGK